MCLCKISTREPRTRYKSWFICNSENIVWQFTQFFLFYLSICLLIRFILTCRYIKNLMEDSGLSVREDAVGNIFGRW